VRGDERLHSDSRARGKRDERAAGVVIDSRLAAQLRKMFLESCIDATRFDRHLSFELDRVITALEERES
jgi:hypothetical protein